MTEQPHPSAHPLKAIAAQFDPPNTETRKSTTAAPKEDPPSPGGAGHPRADDTTDPATAAALEQRIEMVRQHPHPVKMDFHVLAARLHNADTLRAEILDEEFGRLMIRLLKIAIGTLEQHGALVYQRAACGLLAFFLPADAAGDNPIHVIQCALDLKTRMRELGREWKIRKRWLHNIELNIGISAGHEYLTMLPTSLGDSLMPLGSARTVAAGLSDMAVKGQIWTTKEVISQVPEHELRHLRFGIFRGEGHQQVFVARCFSRIRDLSGAPVPPFDAGGELGALAVTQIFDRQGPG
jgi:adenylate cyclase